MIDLEIPDASVFLLEYPGESLFDPLRREIQWSQRSMTMFGKRIRQPRLTAWYGDKSYTYSGIRNEPMAWTPLLSQIRDTVQELLATDFNSVLLNLYRDGQDSIAFHADDERELGPEPIIASLSFGTSRIFTFRHRKGEHADVHVPLGDRSLLVMMGETQKNWHHGIEKVKKAGSRVNLTFRRVV